MRVLVTGGTGFIGHHVVLDLLDAHPDWTFTVLDSFSPPGAAEKLVNNERFDPERVTVMRWDLRDAFEIEDMPLFGAVPVDIILNIASASHVDDSITAPRRFIQNNVNVALTMLGLARVLRPKLFIQFSTDEVYGPAPDDVRFAEWSSIIPSNPYSASKASQEAVAISYWRTYGVPVVITNTMNVFGPRQAPEKFVPMTIAKLKAHEPVPVHAEMVDGMWRSGSRCYTYVGNVSSALDFLITRARSDGVAMYPDADRPERFNLVGELEVTNSAMVQYIAKILVVEPLIEYVDFHSGRPGHDRRYALDGSALAEAGWIAQYTFHGSLHLTVHSYATEEEGVRGDRSG